MLGPSYELGSFSLFFFILSSGVSPLPWSRIEYACHALAPSRPHIELSDCSDEDLFNPEKLSKNGEQVPGKKNVSDAYPIGDAKKNSRQRGTVG